MNKSDILAKAEIIKNETGISKNTQVRVGAILEDIIEYVEEKNSNNGASQNSTTSATAPINPEEGDHWISTVTYIDYTYVSGAWIEL